MNKTQFAQFSAAHCRRFPAVKTYFADNATEIREILACRSMTYNECNTASMKMLTEIEHQPPSEHVRTIYNVVMEARARINARRSSFSTEDMAIRIANQKLLEASANMSDEIAELGYDKLAAILDRPGETWATDYFLSTDRSCKLCRMTIAETLSAQL